MYLEMPKYMFKKFKQKLGLIKKKTLSTLQQNFEHKHQAELTDKALFPENKGNLLFPNWHWLQDWGRECVHGVPR